MNRSLRLGTVLAAMLAAFVLSAAAAGVPPATAALSDLPEEVSDCLDCHEDADLEKETSRGEILSLTVEEEVFAGSVHSRLGCTGCHGGINLDDHPEESEIPSLSAYQRASSRVCKTCHSERRIEQEPMHRYLVSKAGAPPCAVCHDAHRMQKIEDWKAAIDDRTYCLTCHSQEIRLGLDDGESLSLTMQETLLDESVHTDHDCTDCHADFGRQSHEVRDFESRRQHSVTLTEVCRECHEEKFDEMQDSIHQTVLAQGNLFAPVCIDCHGYHDVGPKETLEVIAGVPCRTCHQKIFDAYRESMHAMAREGKGHLEAPICADCHQTHAVRAAGWAERLKDVCLSCHEGEVALHDQWLPNSGLHLDAVACPACHAPAAERRIDLQIYDAEAGRPVTEEQFRSIVGEELERGDVSTLGAVDLWNLLRRLNAVDGGGEVTVLGRLEVRSGVDAHRMAWKGDALRDCELCHRQGAEPFASVAISLLQSDGRSRHLKAEKDVLTSAVSIDSVRNFYALGSTRIKILDFLLIAAVLGGMSVPAMHMTARILARKK